VLGLEAVLPTGEIVSAGTRTRKGVVGYDLARLIVGSEGTLGVITRLFLRLVPKPRAAFAQVAVFRDLPAATRAVAKVMAGGVTPSAIEFLDEKCVELVRDLLPFADVKPGSALLLLETDGMEGPARQEMLLALDMVRQCGATHFLPAEDEAARQRLWAMRRALGDRLHEKWPVCVPEDVAVPLTSIADTVAAIPAAEERHGVTIYAFGHAGDGNVHLNIATDDQAKLPAVEAAIREMIGRVLEMGGTISGEHGIGLAKKPYLPLELTPESIRLQRAIKRAFDPNDILNPGKIF
jgi:D-lactate dehydrogenase (cytochrome)